MKEYDLQRLIEEPDRIERHIEELMKKQALFRQAVDAEEIEGHIRKSMHNLRFVVDIIGKGYPDWALSGCYYACYHAALALIQTKGYTSKNHLATLCVIIKEFYKKELTKEDIELLSAFLDYEDVLFYVETKNKREDATYSTLTRFDRKDVEMQRIKAALFVNKIKNIIENQRH